MGRKNDFPELKAIGLYAANTAGNGNCLFHSLSDQLYGDQSHHTDLRAATIKYMRENPDEFKAFIVVNPGGGSRRNPKRKNAGGHSASFTSAGPSPHDVEATFQSYLKTMAKGGAYGDNLEITAFAFAFKVDVKIYSEQGGYFYVASGAQNTAEDLPTLYIVHHTYEHYSSIRNIGGPHTGLPSVKELKPSAEAQAELKKELANHSYVKEWMVEEVVRSLPYLADRPAIHKTLQQCKGDINNAVSMLLPESSQSSGGSSSVERDADSDDELEQKPKKKQNRRPSRLHPLCNGNPKHDLTVRTKDANMVSPDPNQLSAALSKLNDNRTSDPEETEEENWRNDSTFRDSESTSVSTSASDYSITSKAEPGRVRLKLSQPKKQDAQITAVSSSASSQSIAGEYDADAEKARQSRLIAKPRKRLITRDERDRLAAQKATRLAAGHPVSALHTATQKQNQNTPVIDMGIKVLHI